jgi:hypothetical protein
VVFTDVVQAGVNYYFSVQAADDKEGHAYGYSAGYMVTAEPVARKLYGPSLMI